MENLFGFCPADKLVKECEHQFRMYNEIGGKLKETNRWKELVDQKLGPALVGVAHIALKKIHDENTAVYKVRLEY